MGSLAGAAHWRNDSASVQRWTPLRQKRSLEQKGKSSFDRDLQYWYRPGNGGLSILLFRTGAGVRVAERGRVRVRRLNCESLTQEVPEKLPQG